ncbi:sigma-70 family RNA polymerase sigma factor [Falsigemmobacter intermedius]|uniref:Sigma-70 family RNA polymerase sigma factor n=1 Tax=Falsigemmobacter intermedius TaxID=1553448 RepID=A0A444MBA3_9RHOB|nr:sigma-70 family RNA polymerase sigma factor [Falsigemmobacter intermedius]RWY41022.1 sigma-70 family RNA polymerase sigma factor [Falsigemmobacter intermedius]
MNTEHEKIRQEMILLLPRLRAFGWSLTRDAAAADDLVQLTCEKALRALSSFEYGTRLDAWMFRIMRNSFLDERRGPRHLALAADISEREIEDLNGAARIEDRLELRAVGRAMAALDPGQREVLMLVGVEGLRYREAAEALGLPIGTVMSRLARARRALAAMLGRSDDTTKEVRHEG